MMLVIVPARRGSEGIKGKNTQLIGGRPLIAWVLTDLAGLDPVVTTDDPDIMSVAAVLGHRIIERPSYLRGPEVPISEVVRQAVIELGWTGDVACVQPTSPFVARRFAALVGEWEAHGKRPAITAVKEHGYHWDGQQPLYTQRVNRQFQKGQLWRETGGVHFWPAGRVGVVPEIILAVEGDAATDIDTWGDLAQARSQADRRHIVIQVSGSHLIGSGHLRRAKTLAAALGNHDVTFFAQYPVIQELEDWKLWPQDGPVDLWICDVLDTPERWILNRKALSPVVSFEDHGPGVRHADLVINALYHPPRETYPHALYGPRWAVLRPEFVGLGGRPFKKGADKILSIFGGLDP